MKKIFSQDLMNMFQYASINLLNHREVINNLNVFPVPDGDTGSNMSTTFATAYHQIANHNFESVAQLARSFSRAMLMSARGNSGVILSQIFRGFSDHLQTHQLESLTPLEFAQALQQGAQSAYQSVLNPTEGTMLTVIREVSDRLVDAGGADDFEALLQFLVTQAEVEVERTPSLLPILQEVGVVDSGAKGLLVIFEGFGKALRQEELPVVSVTELNNKISEHHQSDEFGYCTESIVILEVVDTFDLPSFRQALDAFCTSVVVAQDGEMVKVHVHSLRPGDVFNFCQDYGKLTNLKVENMELQHQEFTQTEAVPYALIAPTVSAGLRSFLSNIGVTTFVGEDVSENPSIADFVQAINNTRAQCIFLLPNNSNIILTAKAAIEMVPEKKVILIPTENIAQGIGACLNFNAQCPPDENTQGLLASLEAVSYGQISSAVRESIVNGVKISPNDYLAIQEKTILASDVSLDTVFRTLVEQMLEGQDYEILYLFWGKALTDEEITALQSWVEERYSLEVMGQRGDQEVHQVLLVAI